MNSTYSTYTEYLSSHYPPEIRRRWRLLEILEDDRVREVAGWDLDTVAYLGTVLRVLCSEEPEVGRWPADSYGLDGGFLFYLTVNPSI